MNEQIIKKLKEHGIEFQIGLTVEEILNIEDIYEIKFPDSLRELLMMALPVSKGFYNWRDTGEKNVMFIRETINRPFINVNEMAEEVYWNDNWGYEPKDEEKIALEVRKRLRNAPKLIPFYSHRYMPMLEDKNPPIISIHGIDIIYYGKNIEEYIEVEFSGKNQNTIDFQSIKPIQFWSEIM